MTKPETEAPAFEKEVVRLPDGRELTYYRFPDPPPLPEQAGDDAGEGERRPRRMSLGQPASGPPMRDAASPQVQISSEQGARGSRGSPGEATGNRGSPDKKER